MTESSWTSRSGSVPPVTACLLMRPKFVSAPFASGFLKKCSLEFRLIVQPVSLFRLLGVTMFLFNFTFVIAGVHWLSLQQHCWLQNNNKNKNSDDENEGLHTFFCLCHSLIAGTGLQYLSDLLHVLCPFSSTEIFFRREDFYLPFLLLFSRPLYPEQTTSQRQTSFYLIHFYIS